MRKKNKGKPKEYIWFTAQGEEDNKPLIFRGREHIPADVTESDYPFLLSIYWPYDAVNESGMPDEETEEAHVDFEDALNKLDSPNLGFLMLIVTGNGRKEWHWYVVNDEVWMNRFNELLADYPVFPIQIEADNEPDWALYHSFISGLVKN